MPLAPPPRVLAVRPYGTRIKTQVFDLLRRSGWPVDPESIPPGTSDEEAIRRTLASGHRALLVPFHGHRAQDGRPLTGLHFLHQLAREVSAGGPNAFPFRVIMPATQFARASIELSGPSSDPLVRTVRDAVLFVEVDRLDVLGLIGRVQDHLEGATRP